MADIYLKTGIFNLQNSDAGYDIDNDLELDTAHYTIVGYYPNTETNTIKVDVKFRYMQGTREAFAQRTLTFPLAAVPASLANSMLNNANTILGLIAGNVAPLNGSVKQ